MSQSKKKSLLQQDSETCFLCRYFYGDGSRKIVDLHHIYNGPNRQVSDQHGFMVYLCKMHHTDSLESVHRNVQAKRLLQRLCQEAYEKNHTREEFVSLIGESFLDVKDLQDAGGDELEEC